MAPANNEVTTRIIAVANQKGGVGKTTTSINLAAAMAQHGKNILLVDLDPQGNASTGIGIDQVKRGTTIFDVLVSKEPVSQAIQTTSIDNLFVIPANSDLASADLALSQQAERTSALKVAFTTSAQALGQFDYIIIDCPPTLNLLTINALVCCHTVLIPLQAEFYALEGLSQLMLTIREVRHSANANIRLEGILITMYDGRNRLAQQVEEDVRANLGDLVFQTRIPRNVRLSEAPSFALPITSYDPTSRGSEAYRALADEILSRHSKANPTQKELL